MPKFDRPEYDRMELFLPRELVRALQRATRGESTTAWVCALIAAKLGVPYTPPKRGRPAKPRPARKGKGERP